MQKTGNLTSLSDHTLAYVVGRVQAIEARYEIAAIQPNLEACNSLLHQKDLIDVGIFGRFKAGKSSLLNNLVDTPLLPVGVTPVTAVVTRIRYGPGQRAVVHYSRGRTVEVPVKSVKSFVAELENPENRKKVASVTVELPSLVRFQGLQFVDAPGLDSVLQHNTDAALSWLPKVGLALVAISVDPPLSKQDVALIRTLRSYTPKIAIVVTKADLLSDGETAEITAFIGEKLCKEFDTEFRIFPFSIRPEYAGLRTALEMNLLQPLLQNRDAARADIVRFKFDALVAQTREYLSLALAAAERADADRSKLKSQILNEKTSFESIRMELQALARECVSRTRPWIMKRMDEIRPGIVERVTEELSDRMSGLKGNLWKLSRAFEQCLWEAVARDMREVSQCEGDYFCIPLEKAESTLSRAVQGFHDRLAGNIERALGIRFTPGYFASEVKKPSTPDISIGSLFLFNTDLLWFIIPMAIFRSLVEKHFLGMIPYEVEKNLSRLASQWTEGINAAIRSIQTEAERSVRDQIATVESLLSRSQSEAEGIQSDLAEIELQSSLVRS